MNALIFVKWLTAWDISNTSTARPPSIITVLIKMAMGMGSAEVSQLTKLVLRSKQRSFTHVGKRIRTNECSKDPPWLGLFILIQPLH